MPGSGKTPADGGGLIMAANEKAAFPFKADTLEKAASNTQVYHNRNRPISQQYRPGDQSHVTRRWLKTLLVQLACWETLPAALAVILAGGLRHD